MKKKIKFYLSSSETRKLFLIKIINLFYNKYFKFITSLKRVLKLFVMYIIPLHKHDKLLNYINKIKSKYLNNQFNSRCYIQESRSITDFFKILNDHKINYVILRWFKELPNIKPGEDIDILVDDKDLKKIRSYCLPYNNGGQKLDIYSVTGILDSDYLGAPYYPSKMSRIFLKKRKLYNKYFYGLEERDYFIALAFHAIFHKGPKSGLAYKNKKNATLTPDHNYKIILKKIGAKYWGSFRDYSFSGLYKHLKKLGYIPEIDTIKLLATENSWLHNIVYSDFSLNASNKGELIVFILREWAYENNKIELIKNIILSLGFDILYYSKLNKKNQKNAKERIRGGRWDSGPYPICGGLPKGVIVCFDYSPIKPKPEILITNPKLTNSNILLCKRFIRNNINKDLLFTRHANFIHSSDSQDEAKYYIDIVAPKILNNILHKIKLINQSSYYHRKKILKTFVKNGSRSKTELIKYNGIPCILKTFKPGRERFMKREKFIYQNFSSKIQTLPKLIKSGQNYLIIEYIDNCLEGKTEKNKATIIKSYTKEILMTLKFFYKSGYAIIGFHPGNLIISGKGKLKIVDFEFAYKYKKVPLSFSDSFDIKGIPNNFDGDLPRGDTNHNIENTWKNYFNMKIYHDFMKE